MKQPPTGLQDILADWDSDRPLTKDGLVFLLGRAFEAGRQFQQTSKPASAASAVTGEADLQGRGWTTKDVRTWALSNGKEVAPTGRLPHELLREYLQAVGGR